MIDPLTGLTIASALVNMIGNVASKPKNRNFNAAREFVPIRRGILENTEAITAPMRQSAGESANARGLTGGAAAQVVAQAEAPARAQANRDLNNAWTQLSRFQSDSRYQDVQNNRNWWGGFLGDIAATGGTLAGAFQQDKTMNELAGILGINSNPDAPQSSPFGGIAQPKALIGAPRQPKALLSTINPTVSMLRRPQETQTTAWGNPKLSGGWKPKGGLNFQSGQDKTMFRTPNNAENMSGIDWLWAAGGRKKSKSAYNSAFMNATWGK